MLQKTHHAVRVITFNSGSVSIWRSSGGEWEGIFVDVWEKLANHLQLKYNITQSSSWGGMLQSLLNNSSDIALHPLNRVSISANDEYRLTTPVFTQGTIEVVIALCSTSYDSVPTKITNLANITEADLQKNSTNYILSTIKEILCLVSK